MCNTCGGPILFSRRKITGGSLKNKPFETKPFVSFNIYTCIHRCLAKGKQAHALRALRLLLLSARSCCLHTQAPRPRSKHRHSQSHRASARSEQSILARKVRPPPLSGAAKTTTRGMVPSGTRVVLKGILKYQPIHATLATL